MNCAKDKITAIIEFDNGYKSHWSNFPEELQKVIHELGDDYTIDSEGFVMLAADKDCPDVKAAAPELLEALKILVESCSFHEWEVAPDKKDLVNAIVAIKKAS